MAFKAKQKVISAKVETTYGTDATPTVAANAILAFDFDVQPMPATHVEREPLRDHLGNTQQPVDGEHVTMSFAVEATGSGTKDVPPGFKDLLRACGLAETITAIVKVEYDPVSASEDSATVYFYHSGNLHKVVGVRGSVEFVFGTLDVPRFKFSFVGLYVAPTAVALPAPSFTAFKLPVMASKAGTPTFTLDAFAAKLATLNIDLGVVATYRNLIGAETVDITDRKPAGTIEIESPDVTAKDFFSLARAGTPVVLALVHGSGDGNVVQVDAPKIQIKNPSYGERDGVATLSMELLPLPNAGDDEIKFTFK